MSNHNRGGTSLIKHHEVLTTKQADFVNKGLSTGNGIMSIKKIVTQNKSVDTELDDAYQKAYITGIENKVECMNKKKPCTDERKSILSDHVKYVTSDGSETFHNLKIGQMNYRQEIDLYRELQEEKLLSADVNVGRSSDKLKAEYLDVYEEGVCRCN